MLEIALLGKSIFDSDINEIKQVLRLTMLKLGIRASNLPTDEEKAVLLSHIIEFYGNHSCEEVVLAFNLALSGKLLLYENDVNTYENFSCLYFSKIMNAYREWSISRRNEIIQEKSKIEYRNQLPYEKKGDLTDVEIDEWQIKILEKIKGNKDYDITFLPPELFTILEQKEIIKLNSDEKKDFFNRAIEVRRKYLYELSCEDSSLTTRYLNFIEDKNKDKFEYTDMQSIKTISKKIALYDYFKKKII